MATFRDSEGTDWKLVLNTGLVADAKRETGVNLALASKDTSWVDAIFGDPAKLVELLWVLCEKQAEKIGVTAEQFGYRFDGPTCQAAGECLAGAIADFFPRSRIAQALRANWTKTVTAAEDKIIADLERSTASPSLTSAPASAASIPEG